MTPPKIQRRQFGTVLGTALVVGLAGCTEDTSEDADDPGDPGGPDGSGERGDDGGGPNDADIDLSDNGAGERDDTDEDD